MHRPVLLIAATGLGLAALVQPADGPGHDDRDLQRNHDLGRRRRAIPDRFPTSGSPAGQPAASAAKRTAKATGSISVGRSAAASRPRSVSGATTRVTGGVKGFFVQCRDRRPQGLQRRLRRHRSRDRQRLHQFQSVDQDRPRCRLLGRPSRAEIRPAGARLREAQLSTATTISSSAPMCAASIRTITSRSLDGTRFHLQGDPRYHLYRRLYRDRRRIQLRLHPVRGLSREGRRRHL